MVQTLNEFPFHEQMALWSTGVAEELGYWSSWAKTRGGEWPEDFAKRTDAHSQLSGPIVDLVDKLGTECKILDVGSGPLTYLGKNHNGVKLAIDACDPLARAYNVILQINGVQPVVKTEFADAEHLSAFYPESAYDITHCRNALDHSLAPLTGIAEMLRVTKVGGYAVLVHYLNEAEEASYNGLHQYNFDIREGRFVIWNKSGVCDVEQALPVKTQINAYEAGNRMFVAIIKKLEEFADKGPHRHTADTETLLEYVFDIAIGEGSRQLAAATKAIQG